MKAHVPHMLSRRHFIRFTGIAGTFGVLHQFLPIPTEAANTRHQLKPIIGIWLDGGMSQIDSFDSKPDAPAEIRGEIDSIRTKTEAVFSEWFPHLAVQSDHFALLRAMRAESNGVHSTAYDEALIKNNVHLVTNVGRQARGIPYVLADPLQGTPFAEERRCFRPDDAIQLNWDHQWNRFTPPSFHNKNDDLPSRRMLLKSLEDQSVITGRSSDEYHIKRELALRLLQGSMDSFKEPTDQDKERYGDTPIGHAIATTRKLVEQGNIGIVMIRSGPWDHHYNIYQNMPSMAKGLDQAVAALIEDIYRGLNAVLFVRGEFGRTPLINGGAGKTSGRDHWTIHSALLAGGAIINGVVYGKTCPQCKEIRDGPVSNEDFTVTLLEAAGMEPNFANPPLPILKRRLPT